MAKPDVFATPNMLNATLPLKQDAASQAKLKKFGEEFKATWSEKVWQVLKDSNIVHYARFTVIDNKYMQILTEFDGDFIAYSRFFAERLPDFFSAVFELVDKPAPPGGGGADDLAAMFEYIDEKNLRSVGGIAFSAIGPVRVADVKKKLDLND